MLLGIVFVIIFLSILILIHELGHFLAAKKFGLLVEEFGFGLPPRLWSKKIGETVYSVNALPFGGFVKIYGEDRIEADERGFKNDVEADLRGRNFSSKPARQRAIILFAGVFMNFLLGWLVISIVFSIGIPAAIFITDVASDGPAAAAGLMPGDKIINIEADLSSQILQNKTWEGERGLDKARINADNFIKFVDEHRGKTIILEIERLGETFSIQAVPRINPPEGQGALGIAFTESGSPKMGLLKSFSEGLRTSAEITKSVAVAIFALAKSAFVGKASLEAVAGPVGIVKITAQAGALGFVYLLQLLALISLNLAVINIIPFPALDGGRLLFLAIEKIKGSPLPAKFEKFANAAGIALLLLLMFMITIKDISRFF